MNRFRKEEKIKRFLLGELSEDEREAFEGEFLFDHDRFEEIEVVEDELIESYLRDTMSGDEKAKFEESYLATKRGLEKVEITRELIERFQTNGSAVAAGNKGEKDTVWNRFAGLFSSPQFAIAFAILAMAFGGWFLYENIVGDQPQIAENTPSNDTELPEFTSSTVADESLPDSERNQNEDSFVSNSNLSDDSKIQSSSSNDETKRESIIESEKDSIPNKKSDKSLPKPVNNILPPSPIITLFAGTLRSAGTTNEVKLPKDAENLRLNLIVKSGDYQFYVAEVTDANGTVLNKSPKLKRRGSQILFRVPTSDLKSGDFLVNLSGIDKDGELESTADYQFRIHK